MTAEGLTTSCNTSSTSCALAGLQCGQIYNITLTARSSVCDSTADFDPIKTGQSCDQTIENIPELLTFEGTLM